jgi:hypothetical protein
VHTKFWSKNLNERDQLEDLGIDGNIRGCIKKFQTESIKKYTLTFGITR